MNFFPLLCMTSFKDSVLPQVCEEKSLASELQFRLLWQREKMLQLAVFSSCRPQSSSAVLGDIDLRRRKSAKSLLPRRSKAS